MHRFSSEAGMLVVLKTSNPDSFSPEKEDSCSGGILARNKSYCCGERAEDVLLLQLRFLFCFFSFSMINTATTSTIFSVVLP